MDKQTAEKLILKTRDDYNLIAEQFSSTRHYVWADFAEAVGEIDFKDKKALDLGCGNGRIFEFLADKGISEYYGLDQSDQLIKIAKKKYPKGHFMVGNLLETSYRDNEFDIIICLATLHHIPAPELREKAIREISRILKPGGTLIMTNWYFWNKPKYLRMLFSHKFTKGLPFGDFMMPWKKGGEGKVTERYFHAWTKNETKKLLNKNGFSVQKLSGFSNSIWFRIGPNLITIAQKIKKSL